MKEYFNQFGDVTRLRLARNPKVRTLTSCLSQRNFLSDHPPDPSRPARRGTTRTSSSRPLPSPRLSPTR
jgi:hypothetical protein